MANARPGYKRIMGEIPEEMHEKITWYNKISDYQLNVSKAIELCLTNKVAEIEQEAIDYIKTNGGIFRGNNEYYNKAVDGIKNGLSASDVYKTAIEEMHLQPKQNVLRSLVYLPLLPVNRMKFDENNQKICFFVDDMFCCRLSPFESNVLNEEEIRYLKAESIGNQMDENEE